MKIARCLLIFLFPAALLLLAFASLTPTSSALHGALDALSPSGAEEKLRILLPQLQEGRDTIIIREFSEAENQHLEDVAALWHAALWLLGAILVALFLCLRSADWASIRWGSIATLASLSFAALLPFDALFRLFHGLFFDGDSWLFPPGSTMITLFPESLFSTVAFSIGMRTAALAVSCWFVGWLSRSKN